jgi:UTP--glucose-1-phosphate uridylyltransferase
VTGRGKRSIEDHFDKAYELEAELAAHGKVKLLKEIQSLLPDNLHYSYVRQSEALGLGHAVMCARSLVGDEPFAVVLADDLIDAEVPVLSQMIDLYEQHNSSVIGVQNVPLEQTQQYGIVRPQSMGVRIHRIADIVEKPQPENAPSTLGVVGRYVFTPEIFESLDNLRPGTGGEIQLTDAIAAMLDKHPVLAYEFKGRRYDCGSKLGYLEASVVYALRHPSIAEDFGNFITRLQVDALAQPVGNKSA